MIILTDIINTLNLENYKLSKKLLNKIVKMAIVQLKFILSCLIILNCICFISCYHFRGVKSKINVIGKSKNGVKVSCFCI